MATQEQLRAKLEELITKTSKDELSLKEALSALDSMQKSLVELTKNAASDESLASLRKEMK